MEVRLDESDVKTLDIMQRNIEELYERLGVMTYQYQKRKEELAKGIDAAAERRYEFLQTLSEKYELDSGRRWEFNPEKGSFDAIEEAPENKGE